VYKKPELLATRPNQVWTWDITKLLGPAKWTYFYLYVILDIFSRYVVGWTLANHEYASIAHALIEETCKRHNIAPGQLSLHADNGSPMVSKPVAFLMADLGVTKSHSRPHVSDDNPFSEAQFKTIKYRPDFPVRFGSEEHARAHCRDLFPWYNNEHGCGARAAGRSAGAGPHGQEDHRLPDRHAVFARGTRTAAQRSRL
jgi:putative transposase